MKTSLLRDALGCLWMLLVAIGFWGPYAGLSLSAPALTALYAVFLVIFVTDGALRLLRRQGESTPANEAHPVIMSPDTAAVSSSTEGTPSGGS